eukprot:comp6203_c0_seq1/m.2033 comp6203_c0_seq1/g.2033  ORF comp6203_c0_seq1/g.2033 comp6203_c0_seq1/m.2033 type:complete len:146 (-) comp6203_c0_seq1:57-494(-)
MSSPAIDPQLVTALDDALKGCIAPLAPDVNTRTSMFTTTRTDTKLSKFPTNKKELEQYKLDVESSVQAFFQAARQLDNALVTLQLRCAERPIAKLQEEVERLEAETQQRKDVLSSHKEKVADWLQVTKELQQAQGRVLDGPISNE